jgi:hypothetical protein
LLKTRLHSTAARSILLSRDLPKCMGLRTGAVCSEHPDLAPASHPLPFTISMNIWQRWRSTTSDDDPLSPLCCFCLPTTCWSHDGQVVLGLSEPIVQSRVHFILGASRKLPHPCGSQRTSYLPVYQIRNMKKAVLLEVMPCGSCKNRRFGGTYRLHHQGDKNRPARNVSSNYQPEHAAKKY